MPPTRRVTVDVRPPMTVHRQPPIVRVLTAGYHAIVRNLHRGALLRSRRNPKVIGNTDLCGARVWQHDLRQRE